MKNLPEVSHFGLPCRELQAHPYGPKGSYDSHLSQSLHVTVHKTQSTCEKS